ncbi:UL36 very large tegument protein [Streptomyces wedmorensis]|uniref:UL36 very large tegument protein n=1 Tax=Streptomyces wedmorensis TaxID=43759 RepID=UPI0037B9BFBD
MTVYQPTVENGTFTAWLAELATRLRPGDGWYGVFAERDPEGLRACFDGTDLLPWDVVESLLQDAGEAAGGPFAASGRTLYAEAAAAHDRRPGGAAALTERRDLMERERRYAESRARDLGARLHASPGPGPDEAARLEHDLAWVRDDHARAVARVHELTGRLGRAAAEAARPATAGLAGPVLAAPTRPDGPAAAAPGPMADPVAGPPTGDAKAPRVKRRPRGARYAWLGESAEGPEAATAPEPLPVLPAGGAAPRGARFGGAAEPDGPGRVPRAPLPDSEEVVRAATNAVYALRRLRAQGRSGEAHALLCEALGGPAERLPALAAELHRAGLGADWATLLWEAASLPPGRLAAVAGALSDAGRTADCEHLLRQGVARPVEELAGACAALRAEDHHREAHALLTAFVRVRAPEDAARLAGADPRGLVPQLLDAARAVSASRERDLLHALRVAGLAGV